MIFTPEQALLKAQADLQDLLTFARPSRSTMASGSIRSSAT